MAFKLSRGEAINEMLSGDGLISALHKRLLCSSIAGFELTAIIFGIEMTA